MNKPILYIILFSSFAGSMSCNKSSNDTVGKVTVNPDTLYRKYWPNITSSRRWAVTSVMQLPYPWPSSERNDTITFNLLKLNESMLVGANSDTLKYQSIDTLTKMIQFSVSIAGWPSSKFSYVEYYFSGDSIHYNTGSYQQSASDISYWRTIK